ncbi:MAG: hypothetical protein HYU03_03090, partial [Thaumarchaeota archaeon]|nr:hypothetical protein [Nitrososphaerota archaeon]
MADSWKLFVALLSLALIALFLVASNPSKVAPQQPSSSPCADSERSEPLGDSPQTVRYSDQYVLQFAKNSTSMQFNVTATAINDTYGFGPAYLVNGLSDAAYWYQLGLAWNWVDSGGSSFSPGFNLIYQVWGPEDQPVYPEDGKVGIQSFSGPVNDGDLVQLSLVFSEGNVVMAAYDWNTTSSSLQSYPARGTHFSGSQGPSYFFSGLMTEWYHVDYEVCTTKTVSFSSNTVALESGWMCINRWSHTSLAEGVRTQIAF